MRSDQGEYLVSLQPYGVPADNARVGDAEKAHLSSAFKDLPRCFATQWLER